MHRTNPMLRIVFGLILLGLGLAGWAPAAQQPGDKQPADKQPADKPPADKAGADQPVRAATPFNVPLGATKSLELTSKKEIKLVQNEVDAIATVSAIQNNTRAVLVTGRQVGRTRVTITAVDNSIQEFDVTVEIDVEYLRNIVQRVAPASNVSFTAVGGAGALASVVIEGNAGPSENVNLIMRTAESLMGTGRVINAMRVDGVMQVQLDVVIALVSRTEARRMAFDFYNPGLHHDFSSQTAGALTVPTDITGNLLGLPTLTRTIGTQNNLPPNFYVGLYNNNQWLFMFLQILRNENVAKLLAEPHLVTMSGRAANFLSGGEQAVPSPGGLGAVAVTFVPFGTRLTFLPYVLNNGKIFLEVEPEVSSLSQANGTSVAGTTVPGRVTQRVHTSVEMEDGQTFVIGGLIEKEVNGSANKVPVLGDLPFLGAAFSSKVYTESETEMVVMVTPHLVDPMSCNQVAKVLPGQETRSPDDFELFLEGILEAPRGPRDVNVHGTYVPAYKHSPSAAQMPCGGDGCNGGACQHGTPATGLAEGAPIGYPRLTSGGDPAPQKSTSAKVDLSAELLPPLDVPSEGSETRPADGQLQK